MTEAPTALVYVPDGSIPIPSVERIGGKARSLARLAELAASGGFDVPRFVVLTTETRHDSDEWRSAIEAACVSAGMGKVPLAVRSSAVVEDSASRSYAGLFESVLGVRFAPGASEPLWEAIRVVWRSASAPRTQVYGQAEGPTPIAVVIQEMVEPEVSGVAFSVDPVSGRDDVAVVSAVLGLGQGLVSGELDADSHWVAKDGSVTTRAVRKERALCGLSGGGTVWREVAEPTASRPALTDEEARRIAACARALAEHMKAAQDIEWAIVREGAERRLVLLQSRPITGTGEAHPAAAPKHVWDNSNIVESYPGVTSPLTFSFARMVYEEVYRQFCRVLGVPERTLEECRPVFANMLGHVRGRVYYDLLNWYRTIALLPGYRLNREFMERMMGVREKLENAPAPPASRGRLGDSLRLAGSALRILIEDVRLGSKVPAFFRRVDLALAPVEDRDPGAWSAEDAIASYRRLEAELLRNWRTPILNDFSAMIWFGVLCRLAERWLPMLPPSVVNDLLCGETGIRSTEPARRVMSLARLVRDDAGLRALFAEERDGASRWRRIEGDPSQGRFLAEVRAYLREFGDRCVEELKLETVPPRDDPASFLDIIAGYERASLFDAVAGREREQTVRRAAEGEVFTRLSPWRRLVFRAVLARARRRVRDRENLRFERTRVFGAVRQIFRRLGTVMAERGVLDRGEDVFYLTVSEVFGFFDGSVTAEEAGSRARARRDQFEVFAREPAPPSRFTSDDETPPPLSAASPAVPVAPGDLSGIGCCPGMVRAPVRVVRDPAHPGDLRGHILVAERTDPGWTLLFPLASGLLVERGSLLSHSAIVAREIGLPCVVGIPSLLESLADGEEVEMDGARGTVRRVSRGERP